MLWLLLLLLSLSAASVFLFSSFRDAAEAPFVTAVDSVPVVELPFPAVSVAQAGQVKALFPQKNKNFNKKNSVFCQKNRYHINPWSEFLRLSLDQLRFDCLLSSENGGNCSSDSSPTRDGKLKPLIASEHGKRFDQVLSAARPRLTRDDVKVRLRYCCLNHINFSWKRTCALGPKATLGGTLATRSPTLPCCCRGTGLAKLR